MAGDYIPITVDLPGKPEVVRVARVLRTTADEVVGMLVRFWGWAQSNTADGTLPHMDADALASATHVRKAFFVALADVGWLRLTETGACIPNFDRWLSCGAKRRLLAAERQRNHRMRMELERQANFRHARVTPMSRAKRDSSVTREEKRREELIKTSASADVSSELARPPTSEAAEPKPPPADVVLVFPCAGKAAEWPLTQRQIDAWVAAYPGVDVMAECRKAWAWVEASPKRRKTAAGMPRFLVAWLNRATDRGPPRTAGAVAGGASEIDWRKLL